MLSLDISNNSVKLLDYKNVGKITSKEYTQRLEENLLQVQDYIFDLELVSKVYECYLLFKRLGFKYNRYLLDKEEKLELELVKEQKSTLFSFYIDGKYNPSITESVRGRIPLLD